jgi:hypothetical protein
MLVIVFKTLWPKVIGKRVIKEEFALEQTMKVWGGGGFSGIALLFL